MRPLPQPTVGEITDALRDALASDDPTIRELLRTIWLVTRTVHLRPSTYWSGLPEFDCQ